MKYLAPRAVWLFFIQTLFFFFIIYLVLGFFSFFFTVIAIQETGRIETSALLSGVIVEILILSLILVVSYGWAKLTYNRYKYEVRPDGFRKEHGVVFKKYVTIPYERIQNVDIYRGILARLLGLSDLWIQTAGMSTGFGSYGAGVEGRLPGLTIEDAEKLRDELIKRAKGNQGL